MTYVLSLIFCLPILQNGQWRTAFYLFRASETQGAPPGKAHNFMICSFLTLFLSFFFICLMDLLLIEKHCLCISFFLVRQWGEHLGCLRKYRRVARAWVQVQDTNCVFEFAKVLLHPGIHDRFLKLSVQQSLVVESSIAVGSAWFWLCGTSVLLKWLNFLVGEVWGAWRKRTKKWIGWCWHRFWNISPRIELQSGGFFLVIVV